MASFIVDWMLTLKPAIAWAEMPLRTTDKEG